MCGHKCTTTCKRLARVYPESKRGANTEHLKAKWQEHPLHEQWENRGKCSLESQQNQLYYLCSFPSASGNSPLWRTVVPHCGTIPQKGCCYPHFCEVGNGEVSWESSELVRQPLSWLEEYCIKNIGCRVLRNLFPRNLLYIMFSKVT